jgi:hypothetical protein
LRNPALAREADVAGAVCAQDERRAVLPRGARAEQRSGERSRLESGAIKRKICRAERASRSAKVARPRAVSVAGGRSAMHETELLQAAQDADPAACRSG